MGNPAVPPTSPDLTLLLLFLFWTFYDTATIQNRDQNGRWEVERQLGVCRQEEQGQGRIGLGSRKGKTLAVADDWALVVVIVGVGELACKDEGIAEGGPRRIWPLP